MTDADTKSGRCVGNYKHSVRRGWEAIYYARCHATWALKDLQEEVCRRRMAAWYLVVCKDTDKVCRLT